MNLLPAGRRPLPRRQLTRAAAAAFALLTLILLSTPAYAAPLRDLQAHGADKRLWLARSENSAGGSAGAKSEITTLFLRDKAEAKWKRIDPIESRIVGLANRGPQLAILLPGGDWRLTNEKGFSSGRPLPGGARIIAIGSDNDTLWAVGESRAAPSGAAASQPATSRATTTTAAAGPPTSVGAVASSTQSSSASTGPSLALYKLGPQNWELQAELPGEIQQRTGNVSVSLGVAGDALLLAHKIDDRNFRIYRLVPGAAAQPATWHDVANVVAEFDVQDYKLLGGTAGPVLWYRNANGPARLWIGGRTGEPAVEQKLEVDAQYPHAVTCANGAIRLLWVDNDRIYEKRLKSDTGLPDTDAVVAQLPGQSAFPAGAFWWQLTLTTALVVALTASLRRRREMQEFDLDPEKLPLASFSTRLTAGAIDAFPLVAATWIAKMREPTASELETQLTYVFGAGGYVLITMLVELIVGRSLGKLLTGLHVVGLDGRPAGISARILRNVLRVIDFAGLPLALIFFSPLRQRAGDFAAGTLVVRGKVDTKSHRADESDESPPSVKNDADSSDAS